MIPSDFISGKMSTRASDKQTADNDMNLNCITNYYIIVITIFLGYIAIVMNCVIAMCCGRIIDNPHPPHTKLKKITTIYKYDLYSSYTAYIFLKKRSIYASK